MTKQTLSKKVIHWNILSGHFNMKNFFYKIIWSLFVVFCFISCKPDVKKFYKENLIEDSKINSIKAFGEKNVVKIIKKTLPFELPESFDEINKYYAQNNSKHDDNFIHRYESKLNKGLYSSIMYSNRLYFFTKKEWDSKKGDVYFIFLSKKNNEFNLFEIKFKPITEGKFNTIMKEITENHEINFD